ncbi:MAG: hypothetical protein JWM95_4373 [Gemmatimonadetes bacterium]|nr:hypothetical protein [Gemmatimonadota bacterium]
MHSFVGKRSFALLALSGMAFLSACKDKRIKAVDNGITRDSLLTVIGKGAPGMDSIPNVYRSDRYLIDGKNYEIFFFSGSGKHLFGDVKDTIPWKDLTPIAMIDKTVAGKDWPYLDSLYSAHKIPLHEHK